MNKKISLGLALAIVFVAIALTVTITMTIAMHTYNNLIKDVSDRASMYSSISEIDDIVRENYLGELNENLLNSLTAEGYVNGIGDRYSYYMDAEAYNTYKQTEKGEKRGIGIIAVYDNKNNNIFVSEVSKDSPADVQGISKGDVITEVDGEKVSRSNYSKLIDNLDGDILAEVKVTFTHNKTSKTVSVSKGYTAQSIYYSIKNDNVGYIKITAFYGTTANQLQKALNHMSDKGISSLIIDVRNNDDGNIEFAADCLDIIVPIATEGTGALATAVDADGKTIRTYTSDADSRAFTTYILVNMNTAGAAELFACDLRDFGMATLVGSTTAGNGTMQEVFELNNGGAVVLTTARVLPYKSGNYNGSGLTPDVVVDMTAEENERLQILSEVEDKQYIKAMELVSQ